MYIFLVKTTKQASNGLISIVYSVREFNLIYKMWTKKEAAPNAMQQRLEIIFNYSLRV